MPIPHRRFAALLLALTMLLSAWPADAYLDPGTGSIVLQAVIAAVAAVAMALKLYWTRLKSLFGRNRLRKKEEEKRST
jgi:hypothetical protein